MDLAFSMYNLHENINGDFSDDFDGESEKRYYEWFVRVIRELLESSGSGDAKAQLEAAASVAAELKSLRKETKNRMEFFTIVTDRLVAYEYVLNRFELKFAPEEKLDEFLKANPEDAFLNRIISYLTLERDKKIFGTKLQQIIGEIPVQMTKNKLFELIDRAFTLYLGSDETSLDELIYMLKMAGLVYRIDLPEEGSDGEDTQAQNDAGTAEDASDVGDAQAQDGVDTPVNYIGEYPMLEWPLRDFEATDLKNMSERDYDDLRGTVESSSIKLEFVMDFYYELQRCINDALSLCLVSKWLPEDDALMGTAERRAVEACLGDDIDESFFEALEGRIEPIAERLNTQMAKVEAPDMNGEEEEEYHDVAMLARLLSNSLFAEIDPLFVEQRTVTKELIREKEDVFFAELERALKESQKPVKKAIIAKVLEKLPPFLTDQAGIEEYIRLNLFNCRDKAERCAVMAIITEMMEEDR